MSIEDRNEMPQHCLVLGVWLQQQKKPAHPKVCTLTLPNKNWLDDLKVLFFLTST